MSWVTENPIHPSTFTPGSPAVPILGLDLRPPLFQLPGPSAMVSASLLSLMAQIKSTFCSTIWENPRLPPSSPAPESHPGEGGGLQPGPIATFWAAASIPALLRPFPQTDSLPFAFSLTSPPWSPPHSRPPPFPVYSKPGLLHHPPPLFPSKGPRFPGHPLLFPLSCYPGCLRLSPRQSSLPLVPPSPPPRMKPPQFLHHRTWPAGRRPPHAGLRPEQEEGGGETERDRGSRTGPCRRDSPASGSAPRPAPGPKPTLPHPPRTERERRRSAAPAGWGGGHRTCGADKGA